MVKVHEFELDNGLRVMICPDRGAPVVTVNVTYKVGSFNERRGKTGLAHLFEHLMFDNTTTGVAKQYDTVCTKAGGSNNAYTTYDHTTYYINLPSHQLEAGLWLEAERMRSFEISEHALITQRNVVTEEIKQNVENQPYAVWQFLADEAAFEKESSYSWHVYGSAEDVAGVSMADAKDFFDRFYAPSNAVLCIAGDVDVEDALEKARIQFGSIPNRKAGAESGYFDLKWRRRGVHTIKDDNVPVAAVFLCFHFPGTGSDELHDAELASTILGSGRSSVLYKRLVQEKKVASSVGAFVDKRLQSSVLTITAFAASPQITADRLAEELFETLRNTTIEEHEFKKAVNKQRIGLAAELQRTGGIADNVAYFTLFHNDPNKVNTLLDEYSQRTLAGLQQQITMCSDPATAVRIDIVPRENQRTRKH